MFLLCTRQYEAAISGITEHEQHPGMSHIYPIGGGKGGTGKSFITVNLGSLLAGQGNRVVLVDLDLGGSNLHTLLGIKNPRPGIHEFLTKECKSLDQVVLPSNIPNLHMIASMNCSLEIANLFHAQKLKIIRAVQRLPYDYILLDLGAGTNFNTLDFFLTSPEGLFVFTPEPTSIENAFRFVKAVCLRRLKQILKQEAFASITRELLDHGEERPIGSVSDIIEFVMGRDGDRGRLLKAQLGHVRFNFVLNQFRDQVDGDLGNKIERVFNRHFYSGFKFLGHVSYDERVHDAVYSQKVFVKKFPFTLAATDLQRIAEKVKEPGGSVRNLPVSPQAGI
ncbi:MAG: P-loop NTPase [Desulfatiglans sp.]|nr:P-loop NTPase [Desulfatiglans sp.]